MPWPELTTAVEHFRAVRERTLDLTSTLSEQQTDQRARPGTWSVVEVLDHIVQAEIAFRMYQRQALERAQSGASGTIRIGFREIDTRLRPLPRSWMPFIAPILLAIHSVTPFKLRLAVMRKPGRVWAAAPKVALPQSGRTLAELRASLRTEQQKTAALFEGILPEILPRVRVSHPLYGSSNIAQMVTLMAAHEERHQYQLMAILKPK